MPPVPAAVLSSLRAIQANLARLARVTGSCGTGTGTAIETALGQSGSVLSLHDGITKSTESSGLEALCTSASLRTYAWKQAVHFRLLSSASAGAQLELRALITALEEQDPNSHACTVLERDASHLEKAIEEHLIDEVMRWVPCAANNCTVTVRAACPTAEANQWAAQLANMYASNATRNDFHVDETFDRASGVYSIRIQSPHPMLPRSDEGILREWSLFPTGWFAHEAGVHARISAQGNDEDLAIVKVAPHERVIAPGRLAMVNPFDVLKVGDGLMHLPTGWMKENVGVSSHEQCLQELEASLQKQHVEQIKDHSRFTLLMRQATGITAAHGPTLRTYSPSRVTDHVSQFSVNGHLRVTNVLAGGSELDLLLNEALDHFALRCCLSGVNQF